MFLSKNILTGLYIYNLVYLLIVYKQVIWRLYLRNQLVILDI